MLIVAIFAVGVAAPLVPSFLRSFRKVDPLPKTPPLEADRIKHSLGFSMIKPSGWSVSIEPDAVIFSAKSDGAYSEKLSDDIFVFHGVRAKAKEEHVANYVFQGRPAFRKTLRSQDMKMNGYLFVNIILDRGGKMYEIDYRRWADPPPLDIPPEIQSYINSFKPE
jgi:hypothetical protein